VFPRTAKKNQLESQSWLSRWLPIAVGQGAPVIFLALLFRETEAGGGQGMKKVFWSGGIERGGVKGS
jgi:hypothetical protein